MKSVLERALGTDKIWQGANNGLHTAMTEFFSSIYHLTFSGSSILQYKTGFSELGKYPDALKILESQSWFSLIKERLF